MLHNIHIPGPNNQNQINQGVLNLLGDIARTMKVSPGKTRYLVSAMDLHPDIVSQVILAMSLVGWRVIPTSFQLEIVATHLTSTFGR